VFEITEFGTSLITGGV